MRVGGVGLLVLAAGCFDRLPALPSDSNDAVPTTIEFTSALQPATAGEYIDFEVVVLDQRGRAIEGQSVTAKVDVASGENPDVTFPLGNTCTATRSGCLIKAKSEGKAGIFEVSFSSGAARRLVASVEVRANAAFAVIEIEPPGRAKMRWERALQSDPLAGVDPVRIKDTGAPTPIVFRLLDRFGNPVAAELDLRVRSEQLAIEEDPDAGVGGSHPVNAALVDQPEECADAVFAARQTLLVSGAVILCLRVADRLGGAKIELTVRGVTEGHVRQPNGELENHLSLPIFAATAGTLRLVAEGSDLGLTCPAGADSTRLTVRTEDENGQPVPALLLRTESVGLAGVEPADEQRTGVDGRVQFWVHCPARRADDASLSVFIAGDEEQRVTVPVVVQTGTAALVTAVFDNDNERNHNRMLMGEVRTLVIEVRDVFGNVLANNDVSVSLPGDACDRLRFSLDTPSCDALANQPINPVCGAVGDSRTAQPRVCRTNSRGNILLPLRARGSALRLPVPLTISAENALGTDPVVTLPLAFSAGPASRITFSSDSIDLFHGAPGVDLNIWVIDREGNPKSGVPITLNTDAEAVLVHPVGGRGDTVVTAADGIGRVRVELAEDAPRAGVFEVTATARLVGGREGSAFLSVGIRRNYADHVVITQGGAPMRVADELTPSPDWRPAGFDGEAYSVHGRVGAPWPAGLVLSVRNAGDGVIAHDYSVAAETISVADGCDPLAALLNGHTSAETGLLDLSSLGLRFGTGAKVCAYRLTAGQVTRTLYVVQSPGRPSGGEWQQNRGTENEPVWQSIPNGGNLGSRLGFADQPASIPFDQGWDLRLTNPDDVYGNAIRAGTRMVPALRNAFSVPEVPVLERDGAGTVLHLRVAGGPDFRAALDAYALIEGSTFHGWDTPPSVDFRSLQGRPRLRLIQLQGVDRKAFSSTSSGRVLIAGTGANALAVDRFADLDTLYRNDDNPDLDEDPEDLLGEAVAAENAADAQMVLVDLWGMTGAPFGPVLPDGTCDAEAPLATCSRLLITQTHTGNEQVQAHPIGRYPLTRLFGQVPDGPGSAHYYRAVVPLADLRHGGVFSAAVESDEVEGERVFTSLDRPIYAPQRATWRARGAEVLPPLDDEDGPHDDDARAVRAIVERYEEAGTLPAGWRNRTRILQVSPVQLDLDPAQELLICGDDAFGGWVALFDPDTERAGVGASPFGAGTIQAKRTYYSLNLLGEENAWAESERFTVGSPNGPGLCLFERNGPDGQGYVVSRGLATSARRSRSRVVFTPWVAGTELGAPVTHTLTGIRDGLWNPEYIGWQGETLLAWGEAGCFYFVTTGGEGGGARVLGGQTLDECPPTPSYGGFALDVDGDLWPDRCAGTTCYTSQACGGGGECADCVHSDEQCLVGRLGWRGGAAELLRLPGRIVAKVEWGGREGLVAFTRHSSSLAWYDFERLGAGCGVDGCPQPTCGNGVLERGEACEVGPGCSDACALLGAPAGAMSAGLTIPFAAAEWDVGNDKHGTANAFSTSPLPMNVSVSSGVFTHPQGFPFIGAGGLSFTTFSTSRASCRRMGGDLISENQFDRATRAAGGLAARIYPWGDTAAVEASRLTGTNDRVGRAWLGATREGLVGVGDNYDSENGHDYFRGNLMLDTYGGRVGGVGAQRGPFDNDPAISLTRVAVNSGALSGRGALQSNSYFASVRCAWRRNPP